MTLLQHADGGTAVFSGHVAELADALALGASRETCGGSNPSVPTHVERLRSGSKTNLVRDEAAVIRTWRLIHDELRSCIIERGRTMVR